MAELHLSSEQKLPSGLSRVRTMPPGVEATVRSIDDWEAKLFADIQGRVPRNRASSIQMSPALLLTIPVVDGKPLPEEEFVALPRSRNSRLRAEDGRAPILISKALFRGR